MKTAFLFPAFVSEFIGNELEILRSLSGDFDSLLDRASRVEGVNVQGFSLDESAFAANELNSQLVAYVLGCSLSDALQSRGVRPDLLSGYSMGLYAALYAGGAYSFEEGLLTVVVAYALARRVLDDTDYTMGSVIGLTEDELEKLLQTVSDGLSVANTNSRHAHLVTGPRSAMEKLLKLALENGALHATRLNVSVPYHAERLQEAASDLKEFLAWEVDLRESRYPLVSCVDQRLITDPEEIAEEMEKNLYTRINWMATFEKMCELGTDTFVECGGGKSLSRIARFLPGDYRIYPMSKVEKLLSMATSSQTKRL